MQNHIFSLVFQFIPETVVLAFIIAVFVMEKIDTRKIIILGLIEGVFVYLFRLLPLTFGYHSIFSLFTYTILAIVIFKTSFLNSFVAVLKSLILLTIIEIVFLNSVMFFTNINMEKLLSDLFLRSLIVLPQTLLLFLIGLFIYKKKQNQK